MYCTPAAARAESKSGYGLGRAQLTAAAAAARSTRWPGVGALAIETDAASYEELYEQVNGRPFPLPRAEAADRCTFGDISTLLTVQTLCVLLYHGGVFRIESDTSARTSAACTLASRYWSMNLDYASSPTPLLSLP